MSQIYSPRKSPLVQSQWFTSFKWRTSKRVTCNDREHKFAFKIVVSEMYDLQTKEFILVLLLLFLLFPFIHSSSIGIKSHLFHYRHVICRTRLQTAKMQITNKKKCSKIPFRLSKGKKSCCIFFSFYFCADQSLFVRSIITIVDDVRLKRNWLSEKKVVAHPILFLLFARSFISI